MPRSIVSRTFVSSDTSRSPMSPRRSGEPMSMPDSLHVLDASDFSARRISSGAAAAPRRYEELASYGMPMSAGGPSIFEGEDDGAVTRVGQPWSVIPLSN